MRSDDVRHFAYFHFLCPRTDRIAFDIHNRSSKAKAAAIFQTAAEIFEFALKR
jgi:hypothetical protein